MKQAILSLITILVFAGVCAYLLQKVRRVEKKLLHVRRISSQMCGVDDVQKITSSMLSQREKQLKLQHMQRLKNFQQQQTSANEPPNSQTERQQEHAEENPRPEPESAQAQEN